MGQSCSHRTVGVRPQPFSEKSDPCIERVGAAVADRQPPHLSSLRPLAEWPDCWHKFLDVVFCLLNLQACHVKNEGGEGQFQSLCMLDRIIDRFNKMFDFLLSRHDYVSVKRLEMKK